MGKVAPGTQAVAKIWKSNLGKQFSISYNKKK